MGRVGPALIKDWDGLAASLGDTPKLDSNGEIIPIRAPDPKKKKTYVVWVGRAIGLFNNWGLTSAMVSAFPSAIHKSYRSLEAARAGWYQGPHYLPNWSPPGPRRALPTPHIEPIERRDDVPGDESDDEDTPIKSIPSLASPPPIAVRLPSRVADDPFGTPSKARARSPSARGCLPPSPSLSRVSSVLSLSASSVLSADSRLRSVQSRPSILTEGSLSDYDASSPVLTEFALSPLAPSTPRRGARARALPGALTPPTSPTTSRTPRRNTAKQPEVLEGTSELQYERVTVRKGRKVFVVVRGDHPGVYFDRVTALLNAGCNPAMKVVVFKSLSMACWYFVQKYMEKQVGVPAIEVSDSDSDEE